MKKTKFETISGEGTKSTSEINIQPTSQLAYARRKAL